MNVTFSMILEKASSFLHCTPLHTVRNSDTPIRNISFSKKGCIDNHTLYVSTSANPTACDHLFYILPADSQAMDRLISNANLSGSNLALFPSHITRTQLFQAALAAISFYHNWESAILDMIYTGQGLNSIVAFAHQTFQNPMLVYDSSLKVLAYTKSDGSTDRMWTETVESGAVTGLNKEGAKELLQYIEKLDKNKKPFKHEAKELTDPFYSCNIMLQGKRVGMVDLMERHHTILPGELDLLEAFCFLLTFELQKNAIRQENTGLIYNQLILDLMEGSITSRDTLYSRLTATNWRISPYIRTVLFTGKNDFMSDAEWKKIFDQLLYLNLGGRGILLKKSIFFILSSPKPKLTDLQYKTLSHFCEEHMLRCGISDAYTDILQTHLMQNQSRIALDLASCSVSFFRDVRYQNLLNYCSQYPIPEEILHPAVRLLEEYDNKHQSEYLNTLNTFFNSQYNQVLAAQQLHIHRTTMFYRLQKIAELTGLDLNNAQDMLFLQFSLEIYKHIKH